MSNIYPNLTNGSFIGRYRIVDQLGAGGMGIVFRATSPDGSIVALKVLRPELADNPTVRERLRREAGALRRVTGGRTAQVFEVDADHNPPYLVMELVNGVSLEHHIAQNGTLTGPFLKSFVQGIAEAVADIHAAGIIHRDLKPSNVILGPDGVKVVDFGVSVLQEAAALTKTGVFVGTTSWLSPEQVQGQPIATASDVFNLGLLLVFAATGAHAFGEGRPDAVMYRVVHDEPNLGNLSGSLLEIAKSCLQKTPALRPGVSSVRDMLQSGSESPERIGTPTNATRIVSEPPAGPGFSAPPPPTPTNEKSTKSLPIALVAAAIILVAGGFIVLQQGKETDAPTLSPAATESASGSKSTDSTLSADDIGAELTDALEQQFDSIFSDILMADYQVPKLQSMANSKEGAMSAAWGVQLDCNGFYPLREALPFWQTATPIYSNRYSNFLSDIDYPKKYIISSIGVTVFYAPGQLSEFSSSIKYLVDVLEECQDEDFYLPFEDQPDVGECVSPLFSQAGWTDVVIDDVCARRINERVSWDTDSTNNKYAYETPDPVHGRKGFALSFAADPIESEDKKYGSRASQSVHVWVKEGIAVVVTAYGGNADGRYPNDEEAIQNRLIDYRFAAEDAVNQIISRFER